MRKVVVIGAGVAGLCCAVQLAEAGMSVEVIERGSELGSRGCSWFAGGMLSPWCEGQEADPLVVQLGQTSLSWWKKRVPCFTQNGSLVLANGRDLSELNRFGRRTENYQTLNDDSISQLEPDLSGRFSHGLYFAEEAHIDVRAALHTLLETLESLGGEVHFGCEQYRGDADWRIDCRGLAARDQLSDLRGVKGEMLLLRSHELSLSRPIRLLHPRIPLYIVPRSEGLFMVGATMIESDDRRRISARSMIDLLQGAYALHPVFADAEVVEIGTEVRPAFPDNLPRVRKDGHTVYVNGLYRHGFLLAPALAQQVVELILRNTSAVTSNRWSNNEA